jgi:hypothetical protein
MIALDLLLISTVVCFIVDCSGVVTEIRKALAKYISKRTGLPVTLESIGLKPFSCSLCSVWWTCLIYLLFTGNFTVSYIALSAVLSLCASNISGFLLLFKDILSTIENKIQKYISR